MSRILFLVVTLGFLVVVEVVVDVVVVGVALVVLIKVTLDTLPPPLLS
jgi:hypothetical protein